MITKHINISLSMVIVAIVMNACTPKLTIREADKSVPEVYSSQGDSTNSVEIKWRDYFQDSNLIALIDTALLNNQEMNIVSQEVEMLRNEVRVRKGEYLPSVGVGAGAGLDKVGRYTRNGAVEHNLEIRDGEEFPEPLGDITVSAYAQWEIDIWRKLRNAKQSAFTRYLSSIDGRNFLVTNLVSEIANSYYELLALDNQLELVQQNIEIQSNALAIVRLQKQAARVTELAVKRFEAQLLNTQSLEFGIRQQIVEIENKINFLVGRFPQPIARDSGAFNNIPMGNVKAGLPSQLLENRPDIRQAELELTAAKLDIKVAKAEFYPSLGISAGLGYSAFNAKYLLTTPESLMYGLAGELMVPLVNRNAIKANYKNANARQEQALINYERTILNAYLEVQNQLSKIQNMQSGFDLKEQQVQALIESVEISNNLFKSARADYAEVLLTQEEALDSRFELIETKMLQVQAWVNVYRALGGGWK